MQRSFRAHGCRHRGGVLLAVVLAFATLGLAARAGAAAPDEIQWWPGATYAPAIPTPTSVLGYEIGEDFTEHLAMVDYMRRLDAASDRVAVFSVGRSVERRELLLVAISAPRHIKELEAIRTRVAELRDPRNTTPARAAEIAGSTPAIAWMNFANDGNESAAFETAIQLAYHLAAATDASTQKVLEEVVTLIYPAHNPESHSRYVAWMKASATGTPDPQAQEHRGDWRMDTNNNHYQIDLNRDAVFLTQPESRTIVRELHRWNPVVFVDHHGNPDRFFFPPWALPVNPHVDEGARAAVQLYGKAIAEAFDRHGWTYYTHRVFDLHYPGYFDSYPTLNGAIGMTFETDGGGDKGLAYRLPDERITTLRDGILHHFTGAMATLTTTAEHRASRLQALYDFRARAIAEARTAPVKQYVIVPGPDPTRAGDFVELLRAHGIEVARAADAFDSRSAHPFTGGPAVSRRFPAGVLVIPANQPQNRLLRTILDPDTPLQPEFLEEVRRAKTYNDRVGEDAPRKEYGFYDINAWSLPLAWGLEAYWTDDTAPASLLQQITDGPKAVPAPPEARFAYLFPWSAERAPALVASLWKEDVRLSLARTPFRIGDRRFNANTVVVRVQPNAPTLHERVRALAADAGVEVFAANSARVDEGRDLGDPSVVDLKPPRIAVLTEEPAWPTAYGAIWYLLEAAHGIPFTPLRGVDVASVDLSKYNVLVLPDGRGYERVLDEDAVRRLKAWVESGGTLVTIKGATVWASKRDVALTTARDRFASEDEDEQDAEGAARSKTAKKKRATTAPEGDDEQDGSAEEGREAKDAQAKAKDTEAEGTEPERRRMEPIPGVFVRLTIDAEHYLAAGMPESAVVLFESDASFLPTKRGARVANIAAKDPIVSGFAFDESREAIAGAGFLWNEKLGRGVVTCFADDVTFRAFMRGVHPLLLNAVLLGPTFAGGDGGTPW